MDWLMLVAAGLAGASCTLAFLVVLLLGRARLERQELRVLVGELRAAVTANGVSIALGAGRLDRIERGEGPL